MIQTARTVFKYRDKHDYQAWLRKQAEVKGIVFQPQDILAIDKVTPKAVAYVNHGRWVADCPDRCGGAMLLDPNLPYMCGECFNIIIGGKWRLIQWPTDRLEIEMVLDKRPFSINRNWWPVETVDDLKRENRDHGVEE